MSSIFLTVAMAVLLSPYELAAAANPVQSAASAPYEHYEMDDFARVAKFDAHVHANVVHDAFLAQARADGFSVMSLNVDYPDFPTIAQQQAAVTALAALAPERLYWAATFSMRGFGKPGWEQGMQTHLAQAKARGARAVKIWKNIGMAARADDGSLIMLDNPGLSSSLDTVQGLGLPLIGHLGEPYNCWLPLEQMTTDNDREYFQQHPQYHMFLHPEQPSHADQLAARDRALAAHSGLRFVGAHMASLEYDVDKLADFLDRFPQATVDLAARMSQVQYQSLADRDRVRAFFIRYQDRLLYGTDLTDNPGTPPREFRAEAHAVWTADWRYLATTESQYVQVLHADVPGLALPREVIDKVYYRNAMRVFGIAAPTQASTSSKPR